MGMHGIWLIGAWRAPENWSMARRIDIVMEINLLLCISHPTASCHRSAASINVIVSHSALSH